MIRIEGHNDHTPTRRLAAVVQELAPEMVAHYDRRYADLTIMPRPTELPGHERAATAEAWYDLYWSHPAVFRCQDLGEEWLNVQYQLIEHVTTLPPPPRIPAEDRIARAGPVTLDGVPGRVIDAYGGADAVQDILTRRRDTAIIHDRSVDAYDWTALAQRLVELVSTLTAPKLDPGQRARVGAGRLLETLNRVDADRASVRALIRNAETAGHAQAAAEVRAQLPSIDPEGVLLSDEQYASQATAHIDLGLDMLAKLDAARGPGETRTAAIHRLLSQAMAERSE